MLTTLDKIRVACIAAQPEITELKFGCEVKIKVKDDWHKDSGVVYHILDRNTASVDESYRLVERWNSEYHPSCFEVLGRPIRLADVLLVLGNGWTRNRQTKIYDLDQKCQAVVCQWSMTKDDLAKQSEETLTFIAGLL